MVYQDVTLPPLFDDLEVGVTLRHPQTGEILDTNDRLEEMYGYSGDELETMNVGDYSAPATTFSQDEAIGRIRAAADGDPQSFNWKIERSNGEFRWVRVHLKSITIDEQEYVVSEVTDITEYKDREHLLQLVTRVIRHNLRNDMSILIGYAEQLKSAIETETLEDEVNTILDVATGVGDLSNSIREIEQITGPEASKRSPSDLRRIVENEVDKAQSNHSECDISVEGASEVYAIADKGLNFALKHAIRNAIEHNDSETPLVTVRVEIDEENDLGVIRILDNGPAIPEMEIDAIDESIETTSTYHGSGVGLWVMKWCVDSLGGGLDFEQRSPQGNIVSISLPKAAPSE